MPAPPPAPDPGSGRGRGAHQSASGAGAADTVASGVSGRIGGVVLDHVALAVERWADAWPRYAVELGGNWTSGGFNVGFAPAQLRYANGARIEILAPWEAAANPFLRRFLDQHGPGPHHMTFKVPDLIEALGVARAGGYSPVGVDVSHPEWMEAFIHPRQASGIVVQLAQASVAWESAAPEGFPTRRRTPAAAIVRATHAVADLTSALALFHDLLGGRLLRRATSPDGAWACVDLSWPGPPILRLVAPADPPSPGPVGGQPAGGGGTGHALAAWLAGRPGRLHHLVVACSDPAAVAGAAPARAVPGWVASDDGPAWVVEPDRTLGTRLVVVATPTDAPGRGEAVAGDRYPGPVHEVAT